MKNEQNTKNEKNKKPNKKKSNNKFTAALKKYKIGKIFLAFVSICLITSMIVVGYIYSYITSYVNGEIAIDLNEYQANQSQTSIIYAYDKNGELFELQRLHGNENRIYVSLDEIPKHLQNAFIALEDARFPTHNGVDWKRFVAVFVKDRLSTGGSSITQQLVKNITGDREANFVRKFNEICNALNLEKNFTKDEILEAYLNTLYLGSGCYGVKTACEKYFGKDVSEINIAEAACIASITKAPYTYNPLVNPEKNEERRENKCLKAMLEEGYITKAEYEEAINYEIIFTNSPEYVPDEEDVKTEETETEETWSFYVDYIVDTLVEDFMTNYDMSESQAIQKIYYGGLKIYAAIDVEAQAVLDDVYVNRKTFPDESKKDVQAQSAMTIMDYSGRVIAICGEAGEKSGNRCLNRASDSPRQPGSCIKPLSTYAPAIQEKKATWSTMVQDKAIAYNGTLWPKNYTGDKGTENYVTVQNALARSLNTVPARLVCDPDSKNQYYVLGLDTSYNYLANSFKISTAVEKYDKSPAPLATGAMRYGATTLEMAAAYAAFGNGGKYYEPYCYYKVTNSDGTQTYFDNTKPVGKQILSEDTASIMCELLQSVVTDSVGTGKAYKISGFETMGKTGTTSDDYDRWFVGGTPYYVAAVWYGYDLNKTVSNVSGNPAGKIFKKVLDEIHKDLPDKEFQVSSIVSERKYCSHSGLLASPNCTSTRTGWYSLKNMPDTCNMCAEDGTVVDPNTGTAVDPDTDSPDYTDDDTYTDDWTDDTDYTDTPEEPIIPEPEETDPPATDEPELIE